MPLFPAPNIAERLHIYPIRYPRDAAWPTVLHLRGVPERSPTANALGRSEVYGLCSQHVTQQPKRV
jgi:hypothetical protein